jgi:hypothetical protein
VLIVRVNCGRRDTKAEEQSCSVPHDRRRIRISSVEGAMGGRTQRVKGLMV